MSAVLRLALPGLLILATGCTLYQPRPVTFTVRDAETDQPIAGAEVRATYRTIMDFGLPFASVGPREGVTDRDGKLSLFLDPITKCHLSVEAPDYPRAPAMVTVRRPRSWYQWSDELLIRLYRNQQGTAELLLPAGYRGPVVVYFAPTDLPPPRVGQRDFSYPVSDRGTVEIPQVALLSAAVRDRFRARHPDAADALRTVSDRPGYGLVKTDKNLVALRFVTVGRDTRTDGDADIYVVGTEAEAVALEKQVWPDDSHEDKQALDRLLAAHPRP